MISICGNIAVTYIFGGLIGSPQKLELGVISVEGRFFQATTVDLDRLRGDDNNSEP